MNNVKLGSTPRGVLQQFLFDYVRNENNVTLKW